jgi:hypothetical protein
MLIPFPSPPKQSPGGTARRRGALAALGALGISLAFFVGLLIFTAQHAATTSDPPVVIQTATGASGALDAPTTTGSPVALNAATATAAAKKGATATSTPTAIPPGGGGPAATPTPRPTAKPTATPKPKPTATRPAQ